VRRADNFQASFFGFHAQVADDHVVDARLHAGEGLGRAGGGFNLKFVEFQNSLQGQQDGEIVVNEKNAPFHMHLSGRPRWQSAYGIGGQHG
jgi:hypothetical protein